MSMLDGKLSRSYSVQSLGNPWCSKTAGPVYSARLPFVSAWAAVVTPGATGRRRFLMSHFYSGDKVSYPQRLKRPRGALEWQLWEARQTHRDAPAKRRGGGTPHWHTVNKLRCGKKNKKHNKENLTEMGKEKNAGYKSWISKETSLLSPTSAELDGSSWFISFCVWLVLSSTENSFWGTCEVQISAAGWLRAFFCAGAPVSNLDMVAAWLKTSCSAACALTLFVLFYV